MKNSADLKEGSQLNRMFTAYRDRFGCNFPAFTVRGMTEDKLIDLVRRCLSDGCPYKPRYKNNADY